MADERVFLALWPEPRLAAQWHELGVPYAGHSMQANTLHMTLAFPGCLSQERIAQLIEFSSQLVLPRCTLRLDHLGIWAHNGILWLGPDLLPDALAGFVVALHAGLRVRGFVLEERAFAPHITLVRKASPAQTDASIRLARPIEWPVRGWRLVASRPDIEHVRYVVLQEWPAQ